MPGRSRRLQISARRACGAGPRGRRPPLRVSIAFRQGAGRDEGPRTRQSPDAHHGLDDVKSSRACCRLWRSRRHAAASIPTRKSRRRRSRPKLTRRARRTRGEAGRTGAGGGSSSSGGTESARPARSTTNAPPPRAGPPRRRTTSGVASPVLAPSGAARRVPPWTDAACRRRWAGRLTADSTAPQGQANS